MVQSSSISKNRDKDTSANLKDNYILEIFDVLRHLGNFERQGHLGNFLRQRRRHMGNLEKNYVSNFERQRHLGNFARRMIRGRFLVRVNVCNSPVCICERSRRSSSAEDKSKTYLYFPSGETQVESLKGNFTKVCSTRNICNTYISNFRYRGGPCQ